MAARRLPKYITDAVVSGPKVKLRDWRNITDLSKLTRAERLMYWIEAMIVVPDGKLLGQYMRLTLFQEIFICAVFDNDVATMRAILSIARKNGKTALIAAICLGFICGPEARVNTEIVSCALSKEQASIVFNLMEKMVMVSEGLDELVRVVPSTKKVIGLRHNVTYQALAAEGSKNVGRSPYLAIFDETGQVRGATDKFVDAITTAQGAHEDALQIVISTQAPSDSDLLSIWIDDSIRANDNSLVTHVYTSDPEDDLLSRRNWQRSNPALGIFRNEPDLAKQMKLADRMPSEEPGKRNLCLNQRVAQESLYVSAKVWKANAGEVDLEVFRKATKVALGLDLSARNDLTAAVLAAKDNETGKTHVIPYVFCPTRGIEDRAQRDRVPYNVWVKQGYLIPIGGASMDYDQIIGHVHRDIQKLGITISSIEYDRAYMDAFINAAQREGAFTECEYSKVGQGFISQSPRLKCLTSLLLESQICHGGHPLLNMAAGNAISVQDPAGNIKIDKSKSTQRIDPLIAMHQAVYAVTEGAEQDDLDIAAMVG